MIEEYRQLFRRLLVDLPAGTARFNEYRVPKNDGTVIEIIPSKPECASFGVHLDDGVALVDFSFGRLGTWELPYESRNRRPSADELVVEVEQMARAVMAGKCDERRGLFSLTSRIYVGDYTYKVVDVPMLPIPPFGLRTYAPYVSV